MPEPAAGSIEEMSYVPERFRKYVVERPDVGTLGVPEAATRLGVSRTEVRDRLGEKTLIGWETRGGVKVPAEQILAPGKVVPGIDRLLEIIPSPHLAWVFLSRRWPFANEVVRPVDKLKKGEVDEVLSAAPGFGTVFT